MKRPRHSTTLNAGTMADVAFLLLIFFMVVTTFQREKSLSMRLPPKADDAQPQKVADSKVLSILINADNDIMIEGEIANSNLDVLIQGHLLKMIKLKISPIVNLNMHSKADYQSYLSALSDIKSGIHLAKNELAKELFNKALSNLSREEYAALNKQCKIRIMEAVVTL